MEAGVTYTLTGVGCVYKKGDADAVYQLYLDSFEKTADPSGINNVNAAKAENAVRYNLAGQKVNNDYKGVVIMNGKKMLNK